MVIVRALAVFALVFAGGAFAGAVASGWPHLLFLLAPTPFVLAATWVLLPDIERLSRWRRRRAAR